MVCVHPSLLPELFRYLLSGLSGLAVDSPSARCARSKTLTVYQARVAGGRQTQVGSIK